jgi:hypothetical protein
MLWTDVLCSWHVMSCRLGWVVGLAVTLLSACGLIFSGVLFTRLSLLVPRAQVCWDSGCRGRSTMMCCTLLCLGLMLMTLMLSSHGHNMSTENTAIRCRHLRTMGMPPLAAAGGGWCMVSVFSHIITLWQQLIFSAVQGVEPSGQEVISVVHCSGGVHLHRA